MTSAFILFCAVSIPTLAQDGGNWGYANVTLASPGGQEATLDPSKADVSLYFFWKTSCPFSRRLFDKLAYLDQDYPDEQLEIVGLSFDDRGDIDGYADSLDLKFPVVGGAEALAAELDIKTTPTIFVVDKSGKVVLRYAESDPKDPTIDKAIEAIVEAE